MAAAAAARSVHSRLCAGGQQQRPSRIHHKQPLYSPARPRSWHTRAVDINAEANPSSKAIELKKRVELFYTEAFGNSTPELLPSLCSGAVTYHDANGTGCDVFGCRGLAEFIEEVCSSHPLLHIEVDEIAVDDSCCSALVEWHATAAHLLPGRAGAAPTGLVSDICGLDQLTFSPEDGRISSILSFRDRFAEEEAEWVQHVAE